MMEPEMPYEPDERDVVALIRDQHEWVRTLFGRLEDARGEDAEEVFWDLRRLLAVHETAEEEIVYPVLRTLGDDGNRIVEARLDEEGEAKSDLAQIEALEPGSDEFRTRMVVFAQAVLDHAEHEEAEVLPTLAETQSPERLRTMAAAFELAEKAAPTHAHSFAPESATGNVVAGPFVAVIDRVRDAIHEGTK